MERTLTNQQILDLWQGLSTIANEEHSRRFYLAVAKTRARLRPLVAAIEETTKPLPAFESGRLALAKEHALKRDDGSPVTDPRGNYLVADREAFTEKLEALKTETGQGERDEEVAALLKRTDEVFVHAVSEDDFPAKLRADVCEALLPMIEDAP